MIKLSKYKKKLKKNIIKESIWYIFNNLFFNSFLPFSSFKIVILKLFGAKIGKGVIIKPYVKIKRPWKLNIGNYTWIGEGVWVDNISKIYIGSNTCISQGVYLCSGSHDFRRETFDLIEKEIHIGNHCWISAMNFIPPGTKISDNTFVKFNKFNK